MKDNLPIYEAAAEKGFRQHVGVYYMWDFFADDKGFRIPPELLDRNRLDFRGRSEADRRLGSVSGRTAWMNRPYPGPTDGEYGIFVCSDNLVEIRRFLLQEKPLSALHARHGRTGNFPDDRPGLPGGEMDAGGHSLRQN